MNKNKGVSLVELSIVMAVIGLLLAAITEGFSIRKSAEIRGFLTELNTYQIAIDGFDLKYRDLPGDMSDAYTNWGSNCASGGSASSQCNGDADGQIELNATDGSDSEVYRAWQHLSLSEFISSGYTGVATVKQADIGINIPASRRTKVGYGIGYSSGRSRNEITLGAFYASNVNTNSSVTPVEALTIDKKLDDGVPGTGIVYGLGGSDVSSSDCLSGSAYNISVTSVSCYLVFPIKP